MYTSGAASPGVQIQQKWPDQPRAAVRATPGNGRDSWRQSGLPEGGKSAKIRASLGFIWGIRIRIMFISHTDVGDDLRTIVILGRLDIPGTESVAGELEKLAAAPKKGVVVDLSSLKFLASIGIRALFKSAKLVKERGGRMVLVVGTNSTIKMSLDATGVNDLIPMFKSTAEAERAAVA
jgi:anti-anti-sigma factor